MSYMFNFCYHMYILSTEYFYSYSAKKKKSSIEIHDKLFKKLYC